MRILIVDDHAVVRRGLKQILNESFRKAVFGEAGSSHSALGMITNEGWDLVILDINMPGRGGMEVLKDIKASRPKLPVLVLSMHPEDQFAIRVIRSGAAGYMTKECAPEELVGAVKKILGGGRYVSAELAEKLVLYLDVDPQKQPHESLSDREFQVLRLIGEGKTVREIARELSLSDKTVSTYRARLLEKMCLKTSAELIHYAIHNGLVP